MESTVAVVACFMVNDTHNNIQKEQNPSTRVTGYFLQP